MAYGKQDETVVRHWHPGDSTATDGLGQSAAVPTDSDTSEEKTSASGVRTFFDTRIDNEVIARAAVNTRVSTLSTRIVASGVLPTGV